MTREENIHIVAPIDGYEELSVSGIVSTCRFCEYTETIAIPVEATMVDIIAALELSRGICPACDERRREKSVTDILQELGGSN